MLRTCLPGLLRRRTAFWRASFCPVILHSQHPETGWDCTDLAGPFRNSRGFAANGKDSEPNKTVTEVNTILQIDVVQRINAAHFREVLEQESKTRWNMDQEQFWRLCISSGAAATEEEASAICEALDRSGVVLRVKNLVYLRPLEVAEIIYQALPDTDVEVRTRLDKLKAEIAPLLQQKQKIDNHAQRVSRVVLWGGLAAMVGQWVLFARLTFWELSWDVMEPVTYFTGAAFGITAYAYCLWYNEEFGYHRARERIHTSVADRTYTRKGFDKTRFDYLLQRIHRLESSLAAVAPLKPGNRNLGQNKQSGEAAPAVI